MKYAGAYEWAEAELQAELDFILRIKGEGAPEARGLRCALSVLSTACLHRIGGWGEVCEECRAERMQMAAAGAVGASGISV